MGIRTKKYGIADVLNKKADLKSIMFRYGEYELDILPGKEMVKNPTELIGNGYLERLLKVLRKNYDYVILARFQDMQYSDSFSGPLPFVPFFLLMHIQIKGKY